MVVPMYNLLRQASGIYYFRLVIPADVRLVFEMHLSHCPASALLNHMLARRFHLF